jgi:hypothetical protein
MDDEHYLMEAGGRMGNLGGVGLDELLQEGGPDGLAVAQAEATFNQERSLVAKLPRCRF